MKLPKLKIEIVLTEKHSDNLIIEATGSPNQMLGFIARMRFEIDKLEKHILIGLTKEETKNEHPD